MRPVADYHLHTPYCGHARGKTIDYVECALTAGLGEIAFTDHLGRYYLSKSQRRRYWDWGIAPERLYRYCEEIENLRETYEGHITIRLGIEADYVEGAEEQLAHLLETHDFDFVLGSLHCLPALSWRHLAKISTSDPQQTYREYFRCALAAIDSGLFDSLAHLDFIWRYHPWPPPDVHEACSLLAAVVDACTKKGVCIEINANAYNWSLANDPGPHDPFERLLREVAARATPITLGSDAHSPQSVGAGFNDIITLLHRHGITTQQRFSARRSTSTPL